MDQSVKPRVLDIAGVVLQALDFRESRAADTIANELRADHYRLSLVSFRPGDIVLDIGGHVGIFAMFMARRYKGIIVHSFEPFPGNYELLERNLALNNIEDVILHPEAITGDGRDLEMVTNPTNSGGATCYSRTLSHGRCTGIHSLTLQQVFEGLAIDRCRLLKIDCEGCEYEVLMGSKVLASVDYLCGEFHSNGLLTSRGYSPTSLHAHCVRAIGGRRVFVSNCRMSE